MYYRYGLGATKLMRDEQKEIRKVYYKNKSLIWLLTKLDSEYFESPNAYWDSLALVQGREVA